MPENLPFSFAAVCRFVSICNAKTANWLQLLQIETFPDDAGPLSQSVTSKSDFAELLLQIETNRREHPLFVKTVTKASMNCPLAMLCVVVWAFAQIKPAKINLSLFGRFGGGG